MPPKSSSGKEKDLTDEDDVLQAVILADSFNKRFKPLTVGKPRCLLPVCNATLLDWTFESLALAGVQEIFVICRSYAELVKAAIRDSKWSKPSSGLKIVPIITSKETFTPGDAMRDIYTRGLITSDFVLVMGDLVSNVRIDEVVRVHKERRRTNKDAIMTMVVKESGAVHRTRSKGDSGVFVLDAETSECLHYEPVTGYPPKKYARIPREILTEHPEVEIRNDLIDCSIDVCSVEVPSLFQDNFDYGDIRRDFVQGVLTSDLLMKNIHCYVVKEGYAARVADTRSYDSISKDILSRWTFPLVPDDNHPGGHCYEHLRGNKYIAKGNSVVLSRTCKIGNNTLIGAHTHIADNATLHASVIGQRCTIGPNVILRNAYIFDDTHIGAGSIIEESIIGANVRIGEGSKVDHGCLVGDGVILGKNARLGKFERVSKRRQIEKGKADEESDEEDEEDEDSELEDVEAHQESMSAIIGEGSNAIVWPKGPREDDEDIDEVERYDNQRLMRMGDTASDLELEDPGHTTEESDSEESESDFDMHPLSRTSSATSGTSLGLPSTPSAIHSLQQAAVDSEFQHEVRLSLERAFAENHSVDNAAVELKTLRMASNVPLRKVREAVVGAIVEKIEIVEGDAAGQRREIGKVIARWGPLIDKIGGIDAVETIEVLQYHCARSSCLPLFGQVLAALYQDDIVDEDDIRAWHSKPMAKGGDLKEGTFQESVKRCWVVGARMIQQFDEQESDSEEESGEDSGSGSEETEQEKVAPVLNAPNKKESVKEESEEEEDSGSEEEESEEESVKPDVKTDTQNGKEPTKEVAKEVDEDSEDSEESEEESSEGEDSPEDNPKPVDHRPVEVQEVKEVKEVNGSELAPGPDAKANVTPGESKDSGESEEDSEEDSSGEESVEEGEMQESHKPTDVQDVRPTTTPENVKPVSAIIDSKSPAPESVVPTSTQKDNESILPEKVSKPFTQDGGTRVIAQSNTQAVVRESNEAISSSVSTLSSHESSTPAVSSIAQRSVQDTIPPPAQATIKPVEHSNTTLQTQSVVKSPVQATARSPESNPNKLATPVVSQSFQAPSSGPITTTDHISAQGSVAESSEESSDESAETSSEGETETEEDSE